MKILIVDSSPYVSLLIKNVLLDMGYSDCNINHSGNDTINTLKNGEYTCLIYNVDSVSTSVIDLLDTLRSDMALNNLYVVIIKEIFGAALIEKIEELPYNTWLSKPFTPRILRLTLENLFNSK